MIDGRRVSLTREMPMSRHAVLFLVHDVFSAKGLQGRTGEPKKPALYHELAMGQTPAEVLEEVRRNFAGDVIYSSDLSVIR